MRHRPCRLFLRDCKILLHRRYTYGRKKANNLVDYKLSHDLLDANRNGIGLAIVIHACVIHATGKRGNLEKVSIKIY